MTIYNLTRRQNDLMAYIEDYLAKNGSPPSYREMATQLGLASTSGVHRLVQGLEERGHIARLPNRARSVTLTTPEAAWGMRL